MFPFYWNGPHYNALFPLWYYGRGGADLWTFHTLVGLAGARHTETDYRCSWMFPLWFEDNTGLFATPLYGQTPESHWVFPLWYRGPQAFVSPLYAHGEDGDTSWWAVPAALSWGRGNSSAVDWRRRGSLLLDLGGWNIRRDSSQKGCEWWAFPFVNRKWSVPRGGSRGDFSCETHVAWYLSGWKTCKAQSGVERRRLRARL